MTEFFNSASKLFIELFGQVSHILKIILCIFVVFTYIKNDILKYVEKMSHKSKLFFLITFTNRCEI